MSKRLLLSILVGVAWLAPPGEVLTPAAEPAISRVIARARLGHVPDALLNELGGTRVRHLSGPGADVVRVPAAAVDRLARDRRIAWVRPDRPVRDTRTATEWSGAGRISGLAWARRSLGLDGTGVGIAMLDSGVTSWHDDLAGRVVRFVDFVQRAPAAYDDYGHGTHVAGILAGSGARSNGARAGIAPGASLIALKVLDANGDGYVSDVIAAIDYAVEHRAELNIRVMNVSVAATPSESYTTDPLTLAARRAVEAGIVVVAAAGNRGRNSDGEPLTGGITAPGNAPWVLTVGASTQSDGAETGPAVATFSSRGPTAFDGARKPDLVAPGVGLVSLSQPGSTLYESRPRMHRWGSTATPVPPYFSMSGTSMAAPVVSGTVALMLQANPALGPASVKHILRETADWRDGWTAQEQGAGFLNARRAIETAWATTGEWPQSRNAERPLATGER